MLRSEVRHEQFLETSIERLMKTVELDRQGRIPASIRGFLYQTSGRAILRACAGSRLEAIENWLQDIEEESTITAEQLEAE